MRLSLDGYLELLSHEAIVTSRYKDSVGVWTIAVGHTKAAGGVDPAKVTRTLSVSECLQIFIEDVPKYERHVNEAFKKRKLTQAEFDAAVSFHYNTGGIKKASWVKSLDAGRKREAGQKIMMWKKPPEIIPRREKERDLLMTGKYSHDGKVNVYPASSSGKVQWSKGKRVSVKNDLVKLLQTDTKPAPKPSPSPAPQPQPVKKSLLVILIEAIGALFGRRT